MRRAGATGRCPGARRGDRAAAGGRGTPPDLCGCGPRACRAHLRSVGERRVVGGPSAGDPSAPAGVERCGGRMTMPLVTVIVPCRNEARYIGGCLDSLLRTEYPADRLDILVVDVMSEDGTRETVARYVERDPRIRLLPNHKRIAPSAMNIGIAE